MTRTSKTERTSWLFIIQLPTGALAARRVCLRWQLDSKARHRAHQFCSSCRRRWAAGAQQQTKAAAHPGTLNHKAGRLISEHTQDMDAAENLSMFSWCIKVQIRRKWLLSTDIYTTPELTIGNEEQNHRKPVRKQISPSDVHYGWIKSQLLSDKLFHTPWLLR